MSWKDSHSGHQQSRGHVTVTFKQLMSGCCEHKCCVLWSLCSYFSPCSINMNQFVYPVRTAQKTQSTSVVKTIQLMLYKQEITLYSQIHKEHVKVLCR